MPSQAVVEGVSGAVGSIIALIATYPLKTIYTLQALSTGNSTTAEPVLSILDIISKYRLRGLYIGIKPNILESGISSCVYFYLYSRLRSMAVQRQEAATRAVSPEQAEAPLPASEPTRKDIGILASLLVAALAGAGNQLVTMPASVVTTRMQAQSKLQMDSCVRGDEVAAPAIGAFTVISTIWAESGLGGFWAGLLPALVLVVNPAVQYMLYEQLLAFFSKRRLDRLQVEQRRRQAASGDNADQPAERKGGQSDADDTESSRPSAWEFFLASALAKVGATVVTYPMIVVKSRMQAAAKSTTPSNGTLGAITRIMKDEGASGFFKGLRAKILQTALNAALMLMLKEQISAATQTMLSSKQLTKPGTKLANLLS